MPAAALQAPPLARFASWPAGWYGCGPAGEAACGGGRPTARAGGLAFAFAGDEATFPLPWFDGPAGAALLCAAPFRAELEAPWFMVGANAFDTQHLGQVHGRRLLGPLEVDQPAPFARRARYRSQIVGARASDRLLAALAGDQVEVGITVWAGLLVLVEARFARATSRILFCVAPLDGWRCALEVFTVVPRVAGELLARSVAALRSLFVRAFVRADLECLGGLGYRPGLLQEADRPLVDYLAWAAQLPAAQAAPLAHHSAGRMR